jgi:hypothetical protein
LAFSILRERPRQYRVIERSDRIHHWLSIAGAPA